MNIRISDLTIGSLVDTDNGQLKVVAHWSDEKKTYIELQPLEKVENNNDELLE